MVCPKCQKDHLCPCDHCKSKNSGEIVWIWGKNDTISCGHCGHTMHCDGWFDEELSQYDAERKDLLVAHND